MVLFVVLHVWGLYKFHKLANENNKECGIIGVSSKKDDDPLLVRVLIALNPCKNRQCDVGEFDRVNHDLCIKFRIK